MQPVFSCNIPACGRLLSLNQGPMAKRDYKTQEWDEHRIKSKETESDTKPSHFLLPPNIHQPGNTHTELRAEELCPVLQLKEQKQISSAGCAQKKVECHNCSTNPQPVLKKTLAKAQTVNASTPFSWWHLWWGCQSGGWVLSVAFFHSWYLPKTGLIHVTPKLLNSSHMERSLLSLWCDLNLN